MNTTIPTRRSAERTSLPLKFFQKFSPSAAAAAPAEPAAPAAAPAADGGAPAADGDLKLGALFKQLDGNSDGFIDKKELKRVLKVLGFPDELEQTAMKQMDGAPKKGLALTEWEGGMDAAVGSFY